MTSSTAAATIAEAAVPPVATLSGLPRVAGEIDPSAVKLDSEGQVFRQWVVWLPESVIFQDLADNRIWKRVQQSRNALARLDRVRLISDSGQWLVETVVAGASSEGLVLSKLQRFDIEPRTETLHSDDKYQVVYINQTYRVRRKADGVFVTNGVGTAQAAARELDNQYPKPFTR